MKKEAQTMRSNEEFDPATPLKQLDQYEKVYAQNSEFFTSYNPDVIEDHYRNTSKN